jgi:hypothetical protein
MNQELEGAGVGWIGNRHIDAVVMDPHWDCSKMPGVVA